MPERGTTSAAKPAAAFRDEVAARAGYACEYCRTPEQGSFAPHQLDHIVASKHGGKTTIENLAFCCAVCNRRKSSDMSSLDPLTGRVTPLFNPRRDVWQEHFQLKGFELVGLTPPARATIQLLRLNHPHRLQERRIRLGWLRTRDGPG
jgi:hypothetical protein